MECNFWNLKIVNICLCPWKKTASGKSWGESFGGFGKGLKNRTRNSIQAEAAALELFGPLLQRNSLSTR
jgi:hypothetical protein